MKIRQIAHIVRDRPQILLYKNPALPFLAQYYQIYVHNLETMRESSRVKTAYKKLCL